MTFEEYCESIGKHYDVYIDWRENTRSVWQAAQADTQSQLAAVTAERVAHIETIARVAGILRGYFHVSTNREEQTLLECAVEQLEAAAPESTDLFKRLYAAEDERDELRQQLAECERQFQAKVEEVATEMAISDELRQRCAAKDEALREIDNTLFASTLTRENKQVRVQQIIAAALTPNENTKTSSP